MMLGLNGLTKLITAFSGIFQSFNTLFIINQVCCGFQNCLSMQNDGSVS